MDLVDCDASCCKLKKPLGPGPLGSLGPWAQGPGIFFIWYIFILVVPVLAAGAISAAAGPDTKAAATIAAAGGSDGKFGPDF